MRAIEIANAEIGTVTSRVDSSIKFSVITPELSLEHRATMLGFHGRNVRVTIEPIDVPIEGIDHVVTEISAKTPCQRQRAVIFVHWKEVGEKGDFETFYRTQMDRIIEGYKHKNLPS